MIKPLAFVGLLTVIAYSPSVGVPAGVGDACLICDDYMPAGGGNMKHYDVQFFLNDQIGALHVSPTAYACNVWHSTYFREEEPGPLTGLFDEQILKFVLETPGATLNVQRAALQVVHAETELVLLHHPLSTDQVERLRAALVSAHPERLYLE